MGTWRGYTASGQKKKEKEPKEQTKGPRQYSSTVEILITHSMIPCRNVMHYRKYARLRFSHSPGISGWLSIQRVSEALQQALQR